MSLGGSGVSIGGGDGFLGYYQSNIANCFFSSVRFEHNQGPSSTLEKPQLELEHHSDICLLDGSKKKTYSQKAPC